MRGFGLSGRVAGRHSEAHRHRIHGVASDQVAHRNPDRASRDGDATIARVGLKRGVPLLPARHLIEARGAEGEFAGEDPRTVGDDPQRGHRTVRHRSLPDDLGKPQTATASTCSVGSSVRLTARRSPTSPMRQTPNAARTTTASSPAASALQSRSSIRRQPYPAQNAALALAWFDSG